MTLIPLFPVLLGSERYVLCKSAEGFVLTLPGDSRVHISVDEVESSVLLNQRQIGWSFPSFHSGIVVPELGVEADLQEKLQELRRQIRIAVEAPRSSVLIDSTTVRAADVAIRIRQSPLAMLDLACVANAVVFYDRVVVQPGYDCEFVSNNNDVFYQLDYTSSELSGLARDELWSIYAKHVNEINHEESVSRPIEELWESYFNLPQDTVRIRCPKNYQRSPGVWNGVCANEYFEYTTRKVKLRPKEWTCDDSEFFSIQTIRTMYNDGIASIIGIPYVASSIRTPLYKSILQEKAAARHVVELLVNNISSGAGPQLAGGGQVDPFVELKAPFVLGMVLRRISSSDEFWAALLDVRAEFDAIRSYIRSNRDKWWGRTAGFVSDLNQELAKYANVGSSGVPVVNALASTLPSIATATPKATALSKLLGKAGALLLPKESLKNWYLKTFKPHLYMLSNLHSEAHALRSITHEIGRVWGVQWKGPDVSMLERLMATRPEMSLRSERS